MVRGSIVIVSAQGDYGKPRPAVVIQGNRLLDMVDSVTVCFMTSDTTREGLMRVSVASTSENKLQVLSQVQIEKIMTFPRNKVRGPIGQLGDDQMTAVDQSLLFFLDLFPMTPVPIVRPKS